MTIERCEIISNTKISNFHKGDALNSPVFFSNLAWFWIHVVGM